MKAQMREAQVVRTLSHQQHFASMTQIIRVNNPNKKSRRNQPLTSDTIKRLEGKIAAQEKEIEILRETISGYDCENTEDPCVCKRCGHRFSRPAYVDTHKCWPGHPLVSETALHCGSCGTKFQNKLSCQRHKPKCKVANRVKGNDSTAMVENSADARRPQSENLSPATSRSTTEGHTDVDSILVLPSSCSDVRSASVIVEDVPERKGTECPTHLTPGFLNESNPPFPCEAPASFTEVPPTTNTTPLIGLYHGPVDTSSPVSFTPYFETRDQGRAFRQNPFTTYKLGGGYGGQSAIYHGHPRDQSQAFLQDPYTTLQYSYDTIGTGTGFDGSDRIFSGHNQLCL